MKKIAFFLAALVLIVGNACCGEGMPEERTPLPQVLLTRSVTPQGLLDLYDAADFGGEAVRLQLVSGTERFDAALASELVARRGATFEGNGEATPCVALFVYGGGEAPEGADLCIALAQMGAERACLLASEDLPALCRAATLLDELSVPEETAARASLETVMLDLAEKCADEGICRLIDIDPAA